jgi:osmotically-inducible protein OsmY
VAAFAGASLLGFAPCSVNAQQVNARPARSLSSPAVSNLVQSAALVSRSAEKKKPEMSPPFQVSEDPQDQVRLSVTNGIVTIRGSVGTDELAAKVVKQFSSIEGVRGVRNRLTVRTNDDTKIADQLRASLSRDPLTDVGSIAVTVYDGIVFLSGQVSSAEESARAEELARGLHGVSRVSNGLRYGPPPRATTRRLTSGVRRTTRTR